VDEVIDCGDIGVPRFAWRDYLAFVRTLRARRFEAALVLDPSPLVAATPWLAGIPVRAGLDSQGRGFALNVRVPLDPLAHRGGQMLECSVPVSRRRGRPSHPGDGTHLGFRPARRTDPSTSSE
jgi:ADP-heptose:LPS heptosyltransferase